MTTITKKNCDFSSQSNQKCLFFVTFCGYKNRQMGVLKTNKYVTFLNPGSSWFIYTPTQKSSHFQYKPQISNPTKSPLFNNPSQKSKYRTQYRKATRKSTLSPISHRHFNPKFKPLSSYINTKIQRKSTLSPITKFSLKITSIT